MIRRILLLLPLMLTLTVSAEQPPYAVKDPEAEANFNRIFELEAGNQDKSDWVSLFSISNVNNNSTSRGEGGIYFKDDYVVIFRNNNGTMQYLKIKLDGSATSWTTGAP